jgi:hypothetical protein
MKKEEELKLINNHSKIQHLMNMITLTICKLKLTHKIMAFNNRSKTMVLSNCKNAKLTL